MKDYQSLNLSELTLTAIEAAMLGGDIIARGYGTHFDIKSKQGIHNLVTEYDYASEKEILTFIKSKYPDHAFLAEEQGGKPAEKDQVQWVIDPLDGTVNFAHSVPMFAVSIAVRQNNETLAGVVLNPLLHEFFVAEKGNGAYLNGRRIEVTKTKTLKESFVATGFPYDLAEKPEQCIRPVTNVLRLGVPIRRIGVASIDLAYVACGRFDGFFEFSLGPWDCAAGNLLVEESGGVVSTWTEEAFDITSYAPILATNKHIHSELASTLVKT